MAEETLRVLIVDDEPLARQWLEDLLAAREEVVIVGQAADGHEAVEAIRTLRPDLVFLDVQMPGQTGLDVLREIGPEHVPVTVFVTAYDRYAIEAFELAALDYLVKPFDEERFDQSYERAKRMVRLHRVNEMTSRLVDLLGERPAPAAPGPREEVPAYAERIAVEMRGQVRVIPVTEVDFITASDHYAELHVGDRSFVTRERMQVLEARLDPRQFFRIHRSTIVRLDRIESLLVSAGGDYAVRLKDGRRLKVSRSRRAPLEKRLALNP